MEVSSQPKGGEDVDYGWKGKGNTVHMMTEGEGLPLAFDVTGASVSEVTVDWMWWTGFASLVLEAGPRRDLTR